MRIIVLGLIIFGSVFLIGSYGPKPAPPKPRPAPGPSNWVMGPQTCSNTAEFHKYANLNVRARFGTSNERCTAQFKRALNFWSQVLEMSWHEDESPACSMDVIDGTSDLFIDDTKDYWTVMEAQTPAYANFAGFIALNEAVMDRYKGDKLFFIAVHEIGHMLGLLHKTSNLSVMYPDANGQGKALTPEDLKQLAQRHQLRSNIDPTKPVPVREIKLQ